MGWQMIVRAVVSPSPWSSYCRLSDTPSPKVRELDDVVFKMEYELQRKIREMLTVGQESLELHAGLAPWECGSQHCVFWTALWSGMLSRDVISGEGTLFCTGVLQLIN